MAATFYQKRDSGYVFFLRHDEFSEAKCVS